MADVQATDNEVKVVTGAHKRPLPPAGSHEHPVGTVIEAGGKRYQVGYGGEKYVWHEVVPDPEAARLAAAQNAERIAALRAELAAAEAEAAPPPPIETPVERAARLRAELAAVEAGG